MFCIARYNNPPIFPRVNENEIRSMTGSEAASRSSAAVLSASEGARGALQAWISAVQALDPQAAATLYAKEGMAFWGTFGDHCRTKAPQVREYFDQFLAVSSLECRLGETHWREIGPHLAIATGWYVFKIARQGEEAATETRARFTFAFHRQGESWQIIEHHSSFFPENGF